MTNIQFSNIQKLYLQHKDNTKIEGIISGYASVFNIVDQQGDIVQTNAFTNTILEWKAKTTWPKILWQHQAHEPIGIITNMYEDAHGLFFSGKLAINTQKAKDVYHLLKENMIDGVSIGYIAKKTKVADNATIIVEAEVIEISIVTFAANEQAKILAIKHNQPNYSITQDELSQYTLLKQNIMLAIQDFKTNKTNFSKH